LKDTAKTTKPRDPFSEAKDEWLKRGRANAELPGSAFKTLHFVSDHASVRELGFSWFALSTIAANTAMSVTAVRRALNAAENVGLLHIVSGGAQRKPNQYWPILDGEPLAGRLPETYALAAKMAVANSDQLAAKTAVVGKRDPRSGKFTTVENGADYGRKRAALRPKTPQDLLNDLPNDSPKTAAAEEMNHGRKRKKQKTDRLGSNMIERTNSGGAVLIVHRDDMGEYFIADKLRAMSPAERFRFAEREAEDYIARMDQGHWKAIEGDYTAADHAEYLDRFLIGLQEFFWVYEISQPEIDALIERTIQAVHVRKVSVADGSWKPVRPVSREVEDVL
jgi:hypothetical protein